jgi:protoporphyrinogen/coproporphyrinogen III oxidase
VTTSVAIVGGGITGLAAAHRLLELRPGTTVTVLEARSRFGGKIYTERSADVIIEGGADSFLSTKPRGIGLGRELGLQEREITPDPANRGAFILHKGKLQRLPEGISGLTSLDPRALIRTRLVSPLGKARILLDLAIPPNASGEDESVASFFKRRVGAEVYNNLVEPLLTGIYGGDGRQLSLESTFAHWRTAERTHGSLIRAFLAARRERRRTGQLPRPRPAFTSYASGLAELVEALIASIQQQGGELRPESPVRTLVSVNNRYELEGLTVDGVILAAPAPVAASLIKSIDLRVSQALAAIPLSSTVIVALTLPRHQVGHALNGSGYIVPAIANRPVMAMTWMSSKWKGRAPEDQVLIRAFLGRDTTGQLLNQNNAALTQIVLKELKDVLGISAQPIESRIYRWPNSMPQYTIGHRDRVRVIEEGVREVDGLEVAGNMLQGVGIPDCIASGEHAAESMSSYLATLAPR